MNVFLISTRQTQLCEFSAYVAFNKATNGQTDNYKTRNSRVVSLV